MKSRNFIEIDDSVGIIAAQSFNGENDWNKPYFYQTNSWETFVGFLNAHHFVELKSRHRLRRSAVVGSGDAYRRTKFSFR
jgi:hypothetical protein